MEVVYLLLVIICVGLSHQLSTSDSNTCKSDKGIECCYGYILSQDGTRCEACPAGYFGIDCTYTCPRGYYGIRCNSKCNCRDSENCDNVIGCVPKVGKKSPFMSVNVATSKFVLEHTPPTTDTILGNKSTGIYQQFDGGKITRVYIMVYTSCVSLGVLCIILFTISLCVIFARHFRNFKVESLKLVENPYDQITENVSHGHDKKNNDHQTMRPFLPPPRVITIDENRVSKQWPKNSLLEASKDYDYVYESGDYLNPYNMTLEYTGHVYKDLA